jgi:hypothetical protein
LIALEFFAQGFVYSEPCTKNPPNFVDPLCVFSIKAGFFAT